MLDDQILEQEVYRAVCLLSSGKACGPDSYPKELYKEFWPIIKDDLMTLITATHIGAFNILYINKLVITLLPKKEGASKITEFRLINIINIIIRIITTLCAIRLKPILPEIITKGQSEFVMGRSIMEPFLVVRELLHLYNKEGVPTVLFKVDFEKVFDSVNWNFIINLLRKSVSTELYLSRTLSSQIINIDYQG
jgi:Reverse transcriptase (RNA-dependent DNA polymerase)